MWLCCLFGEFVVCLLIVYVVAVFRFNSVVDFILWVFIVLFGIVG